MKMKLHCDMRFGLELRGNLIERAMKLYNSNDLQLVCN